ncbi:hypothetical protein IWX76_000532 [Pedobacter sp. CAN_A7]|uniref:DUF6266 family protein n=1 Tax=Pedobacter sp. CAN_A7 TaxID=2787722 RepID=UPI0018CA8A08
MGIIKRGILGGFRKKTGAVVGVRWRGLDVMRGIPRKTSKAPSQEQLDQQMKFRLLSQLLSKVGSVIDIGFSDACVTPTAMNLAMAYNLKHAFKGTSPDSQLDYSRLSFSRGSRALPKIASVEGWTQRRIVFSWDYQGDRDKLEHPRDLVTVLIYCMALQRFVNLMRVATRADRDYTVMLPASFGGYTIHAYLFMESVNTLGFLSNSMYLGEVLVLQ